MAGVMTMAADPAAPPTLYNPFAAVQYRVPRPTKGGGGVRHGQRARRSEILATIRRLLTEQGCDHVTVRHIAEASGYAVQTIYNLIGPRDEAIAEAISEYSLFVGRTAKPRPEDPTALFTIVDCWLDSSRMLPEFCRQTNLIFFTASRGIYYSFRDRQLKGLRNLLKRQQACGIIEPRWDTRDLAEQFVLLTAGIWLEWADRPFPFELLHRKLCLASASLLTDKFAPQYRGSIQAWLTPAEPTRWPWLVAEH